MKTTRLILGIISIVLPLFILFQSCAAGLSNAMGSTGEVSGSAGVIVALCLLIAGIVSIATRSSAGRGGVFTAAGFHIFGALIGFVTAGSYSDLYIWSGLSLIFGIVLIVGTLFQR